MKTGRIKGREQMKREKIRRDRKELERIRKDNGGVGRKLEGMA